MSIPFEGLPEIDPLKANVLPDSRLSSIVTPKRAEMRLGSWWVPIYCANCGCDGGKVPQENMTFVFWLCNSCFETHGAVANTMVMPDEVFFEKVRLAALEQVGHELTDVEAAQIVQEDTTPLAKLLKEQG